jgi:hypothetical protein
VRINEIVNIDLPAHVATVEKEARRGLSAARDELLPRQDQGLGI